MSEPFDFEHHFYYEKHLHKKHLFVIVIVKNAKNAMSEPFDPRDDQPSKY